MSGFNRINFRREVSPQLKQKAFPVISSRMAGFWEREKERMINEFENHPVTNELESYHPDQRSEFLPNGNLTALFGYEDVAGEVNNVRDLLDESNIVFINQGRVYGDGSYTVSAKAEVPSIEAINSATPLPWQEGKGLIDAVELGVSGFFRTLFGGKFDDSRSGGAIQIQAKVRDKSFPGLGRGSYLRGILDNFKNIIRSGPRTRN